LRELEEEEVETWRERQIEEEEKEKK